MSEKYRLILIRGSINKVSNQVETKNKKQIDRIMNNCEIYREKLIKHCQLNFYFDYDAACDCVQSTYLALYENLLNGVEINNYRAWLYKVTMNYRNKALREKIRKNEYDFSSNEEKELALENSFVYNPDYVENIVSDLEIEKRYIKIISSLSEDEKNLYIEHYLRKKTFAEIGSALGIKAGTIERRHAKLKKKILKMIRNLE